MKIKKLIRSSEDQLKFFLYLKEFLDKNKSIWKEEDLPLLEPFFNYNNGPEKNPFMKMNEEEQTSFEFWKRCDEEYGKSNSIIKNNLIGIDEFHLGNDLDIEIIEPDDDDLPLVYKVIDRKYPYLQIVEAISDFDRFGEISIFNASEVFLSDFENYDMVLSE